MATQGVGKGSTQKYKTRLQRIQHRVNLSHFSQHHTFSFHRGNEDDVVRTVSWPLRGEPTSGLTGSSVRLGNPSYPRRRPGYPQPNLARDTPHGGVHKAEVSGGGEGAWQTRHSFVEDAKSSLKKKRRKRRRASKSKNRPLKIMIVFVLRTTRRANKHTPLCTRVWTTPTRVRAN